MASNRFEITSSIRSILIPYSPRSNNEIMEVHCDLDHSQVQSLMIREEYFDLFKKKYMLSLRFSNYKQAEMAANELRNGCFIEGGYSPILQYGKSDFIALIKQIELIDEQLIHFSPGDKERLFDTLYQNIAATMLDPYIFHLATMKKNNEALRVSQFYPATNEFYYRLGQCFEHSGDTALAIDLYKKTSPLLKYETEYELAQARLAVLEGESLPDTLARFKRLIQHKNRILYLIDAPMITTLLSQMNDREFLDLLLQHPINSQAIYQVAKLLYELDEVPKIVLALALCESQRDVDDDAVNGMNYLQLLIWKRLDMIQTVSFYEQCLKVSHIEDARRLMVEEMRKEIASGQIISLIERVLLLSLSNPVVFSIAGTALSTQYPLLAYCFFERSPKDEQEKLSLKKQVEPYMKNIVLIGALVDECLTSNPEEMSAIIQDCQQLLLGQQPELSISSLIRKVIAPLINAETSNSRSVSGPGFWDKSTDDEGELVTPLASKASI